MKNTNKISTVINKTLIWVVVMLLSITSAIAQTDLPGEPVDGGAPTAPIDDYVWVLALVAVTFAILKFRAIFKQNLSTKE